MLKRKNKLEYQYINLLEQFPVMFIGAKVPGYHDHGGVALFEGEECTHEWVKDE